MISHSAVIAKKPENDFVIDVYGNSDRGSEFKTLIGGDGMILISF